MQAVPALCSVMACSPLSLAASLQAAESGGDTASILPPKGAANATVCLTDLRGFARALKDDGFWLRQERK